MSTSKATTVAMASRSGEAVEVRGCRMRRRRVVASALVLVAGLVLASAQEGQAQSGSEAPRATEIGVTASEIHVAVVADVDNPLAPGLFQGVVDGANAAAKYLNSKAGGGGLAGRKVVVDFIDSRLSTTDSRNAIITACARDFALVGTAALFLPTIEDAVNCPDQAGRRTGMANYAAISQTEQGCAPVSFPVNPPALVCDTAGQSPPSYQGNRGAFRYLQGKNKNGLHGAMLHSSDTEEASIAGQVLIDAALSAGIEADQEIGISARALQAAYTPIVQRMKDDGSNFAYTTTTAGSAISLMTEARLQSLTDPGIVWTCTTVCYDETVRARATTDGLYVPMNYLPFEEASTNKTLANFLKYVGRDKATGFAVYGWVAMLLFADSVNAAVAKDGVNGITRASLLEGTKSVTEFNAGGMFGTVDIANKASSPCTLLMRLVNGKWTRVWPTKKGTFDCTPSNSVVMKGDARTGG
jgi:hypothetical protein